MADPSTYRPRPGEIPTDPGVYRFRDKDGRVIYVGKAKSLRPRLSSYFQDIAALHPARRRWSRTGASVEWTVVATEVEALQLEYSWIKEFDPRFNVKYRDDKSYPYLAVTLGEEFPRAQVMRGAKRKGTRYFGPYAHAWAIRETLDLLLRVFPMRTCSLRGLQARRPGGPPVPARLHRQVLGPVRRPGRRPRSTARSPRTSATSWPATRRGSSSGSSGEMRRPRPSSTSSRPPGCATTSARSTRRSRSPRVVLGDATDADVFALADDELEAAVQVFHVRGGRVRGQRGWVVEKESEDIPELVEHLLQQVYGDQAGDVRAARGARARSCPPTRAARRAGSARCAAPGRPAGARSAATSAPCSRRCTATPSSRWPGTRSPARGT